MCDETEDRSELVRRLRAWRRDPAVVAATLRDADLRDLPPGTVLDLVEPDYAIFLAVEYADRHAALRDLARAMPDGPVPAEGVLAVTRFTAELQLPREDGPVDDDDGIVAQYVVRRTVPASPRRFLSAFVVLRGGRVYNGGSGDGSSALLRWDRLAALPPL